jgi:hypothetical protein
MADKNLANLKDKRQRKKLSLENEDSESALCFLQNLLYNF